MTKKIEKTFPPKTDTKTPEKPGVEKTPTCNHCRRIHFLLDLLIVSFGDFDIRSTIEQHTFSEL